LTEHDIPHRQTIADEIYAKFLKVKGLLQEKFKNNDSRISFTFDAGTSRSSNPYLAVTSHWIDSSWNLNEMLIGFEDIEGSHTGQNISAILCALFNSYGILHPEKVFTLILLYSHRLTLF